MQFRHIVVAAASVAAVTAGTLANTANTASAHDNGKLHASAMISVPATLTGAAGNIRGINGGGLPWSIGDASVSVKASGKVAVEFNDLVFADGPNTGKNTVASMAVVVSCLDPTGQVVNVTSAPFPVTVGTSTDPGGDAEAATRVDLPSSCLAPIVFVTNAPGTAWFAVDGL